MNVVYTDFIVAPYEGNEYVAEFTWTRDESGTFDTHHYFVDYPGVSDLEKMITGIVGGSPMIRYSLQGTLKVFMSTVQEGDIIAFRTRDQRDLFKGMLEGLNLECRIPTCSFEEVITLEEEGRMIMWIIEEARAVAAKKFGNSL